MFKILKASPSTLYKKVLYQKQKMEKKESLEAFYKRRIGWVPDKSQEGIGHFNVFDLAPFIGDNAQQVPYVRRDFYKVMLVKGKGKVFYADKTIELQQQALSFSNPNVPYKWENTDQIESGIFCIFNEDFFQQFGNINQYSVFHPQGNYIFELSDEQAKNVQSIYDKMLVEIKSNYAYKFDVLRNLVFELIHFAMKVDSDLQLQKPVTNATERISHLFFELLERQFPIDEHHTKIKFRSASEFAKQLNIHVNHLNRALKETKQKTTSQIVANRILQEAKILLKQSTWNISEIAFALGFKEVTHFNTFFKKHTQINPSKFRKL